MRIILTFLLFTLLAGTLSAQVVYTINADSTKLTGCDSNELILENHTQAVPGFLYNKGRGRTEFRRAMIALNDSLYVFGKDTLNINKSLKYTTPGVNADWNATSGPAFILNKPVIPSAPTLASVLTLGNTAIAGTTTKAPIVMVQGPVKTTPQPGAVEYDGHGYYITDSAAVRHDLTQTDRVFKIYSNDYSSSFGYTHSYTLIGWNVDYTTDLANAHSLACAMDFEITLPSGVPNGTVISVAFQGTTVYTLTVTGGALTTERYVIGTIRINQDLKYTNMFYVKGATETITNAGVLTSSGTAFRLYPQSFTNPGMVFTVTGAPTLVRVGVTYTIDKKQQGRYIF